MPDDLRLLDFLNKSSWAGEPVARELLELPPEEWEAWSGEHPEALSFATLRELYRHATERIGTGRSPALPITEFMLRHVDAVVVPPDMDILRLVLRFLAW